MLIAYAQSMAADRGSAPGQPVRRRPGRRGAARACRKIEPWIRPEQLDEELAAVGFYLSGHPLEDMVEVLRRRRTDAAAPRPWPRPRTGAEAFRMAGVVRRRQERASASPATSSPSSPCPTPPANTRCCSRRRCLRKCRDVLEPGKAVVIKVRAKAKDGEVRFFGDDAEPLDKADRERRRRPARPPLAAQPPRSTRSSAAWKARRPTRRRGDHPGRRPRRRPRGRAEAARPLHASTRACAGALKTAPGVVYLEDV